VPPSALPPGLQSNEKSQGYDEITIRSLRGKEQEFDLDRNGFQIFKDEGNAFSLHSALKYEQYSDFATVKTKYREAVRQFLKERLGAEEVLPFTHEVCPIALTNKNI
jgi:chloramphenicol O-acetyltransferase